MDLRLLLLSLTTFAAGLAESILIGILPPLAEDLRVSISLAGQLTTLFSLGFALAAPLLGWLTRRIERRRLLLATLLLFALSNALAALAPGYLGLLLARLGMSACCGLLIVLASLLAAELAAPAQRGRAIGLIFMGISGSLVFGVATGRTDQRLVRLALDLRRHRGLFAALVPAALALPAATPGRRPARPRRLPAAVAPARAVARATGIDPVARRALHPVRLFHPVPGEHGRYSLAQRDQPDPPADRPGSAERRLYRRLAGRPPSATGAPCVWCRRPSPWRWRRCR